MDDTFEKQGMEVFFLTLSLDLRPPFNSFATLKFIPKLILMEWGLLFLVTPSVNTLIHILEFLGPTFLNPFLLLLNMFPLDEDTFSVPITYNLGRSNLFPEFQTCISNYSHDISSWMSHRILSISRFKTKSMIAFFNEIWSSPNLKMIDRW